MSKYLVFLFLSIVTVSVFAATTLEKKGDASAFGTAESPQVQR